MSLPLISAQAARQLQAQGAWLCLLYTSPSPRDS